MSGELPDIFALSLVAVANPTLLAATTVMMLLPNPRRLMAGYLLGAYTIHHLGPFDRVRAQSLQSDEHRKAHH